MLQVNGNYRRSRYNRLRGSFDTWKVEGLWAPIEDITFRGAYNKAQRAPGVVEADQASRVFYQTVGGLNDPCSAQPNQQNPNSTLPPTATIEQCRRTGLPDNLYGSAALRCPDEGCTIRSGGFGLTPETAYTTTFGIVLRPRFLRGLVVSADRFLINLNDSINFFQSTDFINSCLSTGIQYYCRGIVRNPGTSTLSSPITDNATPTTGYIAQGTSNGYKSQLHGWDFQAQYNFGLGGAGALNLSFNGSLVTRVGSQERGRMAGGCTTSGMAFKMHGRVGDSPIVGAGLYVERAVGGATATGVGEEVARIAGAARVVAGMRAGLDPMAACEEAVRHIANLRGDAIRGVQVGFLALDHRGRIGAFCLLPGFTYAVSDVNGSTRVLKSSSLFGA